MKTILCAFIFMWSMAGFAADGQSLPVEPPKHKAVIVKKGNDVFFDFQDGRVAGIFQEVGKTQRTSISLRQIENTCDYQQVLANCSLEIDIANFYLTARWVQHPNAKKIGDIVTGKYYNQESFEKAETTLNFLGSFDNHRGQFYPGRTKNDRLICDRMDWAQNLSSINGKYIVQSWSNELMFPNSETEMNENQTESVVYDVQMKSIDPQTLEIVSFGKSGGVREYSNPFLSSQVATLNFIDKKNRSCLVSFEASASNVIRLIRSAEFKATEPQTRKPINNSLYIRSSELYFHLNFFVNASGEVK